MRAIVRVSVFVVSFGLLCSAQDAPRSIHVLVALCDNEHQGIVPVPKALGDGDDPTNNLYWGAQYGVKTFLCKSANWQLVGRLSNPSEHILERCVFEHRTKRAILVADAYKGAQIKTAIADFLAAAGGANGALLRCGDRRSRIGGAADLIAYVGHNGLMDFSLPAAATSGAGPAKDVIVLACMSRPYFAARLTALGARPLLMTTGFMAPEAYTLEAALEGWIAGESPEGIRTRAAKAYHQYQKCGMNGAVRLFSAGD